MILLKTEISVVFDIVNNEKEIKNKWSKALGDVTDKLSLWIATLQKTGKILKRKRTIVFGDVNCYSRIVTVFKDFDTYEEVISNPLYLDVKSSALAAGFEYKTEIKYLDNKLLKDLDK